MENKTYKIGQEFSITEKTANQKIYKIKITDVKNTNYGVEYKVTFYQIDEYSDGVFKKSQRSTWYMGNTGIKQLMMAGNIVEKN